MTVQKARAAKVKVCATEGGTYYELDDYVINSAAGWKAASTIETTKQGDVARRAETSGFYVPTLALTLNRNTGDTNGQTALFANNPVWVQYSEDGSAFKKCQMSWEETSSHGAGPDPEKVSVNLQAAGGAAPAAV